MVAVKSVIETPNLSQCCSWLSAVSAVFASQYVRFAGCFDNRPTGTSPLSRRDTSTPFINSYLSITDSNGRRASRNEHHPVGRASSN